MNQISQHISYLLLTCRKVVVPKLGTFSAFYQKAYFDSIDNVFYPSKIKIVFNSGVDVNDSILKNSIIRQLKMSGSEADDMLKYFVEGIYNKISKQKYCCLNGIGYLIKTKDNSLCLKDVFWNPETFSNLYPIYH